MDKAREYIDIVQAKINSLLANGLPDIHAAAAALSETLRNKKKIFVFGTGHSHMFAEELFYRAGGLVTIHPMLEEPLMLHGSASFSTEMERLPGYAALLIKKHAVSSGDMLIIASNSGRNAVTIELAKLAKELGAVVVALTNMTQVQSTASRHADGTLLYQHADYILDNRGEVGDAAVAIQGLPQKTSPTSTVLGALILNAVVVQAVQLLAEEGAAPEIFASSNVDGGDEINRGYIEKYKKEIPSL